jgi:FAD:protein FMN transferase
MSLSRRDFLKITALAGAAVGVGAPLLRYLLATGALSKVAETHYLMGTIVNIVLVAEREEQAREAIQKTVGKMRDLILIYDHRRLDGPLGQLNANGVTHHPPRELVAVMRQALHFGQLSNGAFDITVKPLLDALQKQQPVTQTIRDLIDYRQVIVTEESISFSIPNMAVTLDGIAKGCVVDGGVEALRQLGFENVLVEAGGDMMLQGVQDGDGWRVGIAHPRSPGNIIAEFFAQNQAVATSGDYMNSFSRDHSAHHIIDPRTAHSPSHLASATVLAPSVLEADALSTTLMVLGIKDALSLLEALPAASALLITKDLELIRSSRFPSI